MLKLNTRDGQSSCRHNVGVDYRGVLSLPEQYAKFVKTFRLLDPKGRHMQFISSDDKRHHHNNHKSVLLYSTYIQIVVFADAVTFLWYILEKVVLSQYTQNQDIIFALIAFALFMYALIILGNWPSSTSLVMKGHADLFIALRNAHGNILRFRYRKLRSFIIFIWIFHMLSSVVVLGSVIFMFRPVIVSFPSVEWILIIINCLIVLLVGFCFNPQFLHTVKTPPEINSDPKENSQRILNCKLPSAAAVVNIMPFLRIHIIISQRALDVGKRMCEDGNSRVIVASSLFLVASAIMNAVPHCNQVELCHFLETLWNWSVDLKSRENEFSFAFEDVSASQSGLNDAGQTFYKQSFHVTNSVSFLFGCLVSYMLNS